MTFSRRDFVPFLQLPFPRVVLACWTEVVGIWNVICRINIPRTGPGPRAGRNQASLITSRAPRKGAQAPNPFYSGKYFGTAWLCSLSTSSLLAGSGRVTALFRRKSHTPPEPFMMWLVYPSALGKEWICKLPGFGGTLITY